jgi:uncharacterized membrane protein
MSWLADHAYIAAWLSPIITLVGIIVSSTINARTPDWSRLMIYVGFLTALAVLFTSSMDDAARWAAFLLLIPLTVFIIWDAVVRAEKK